MKKILSFIFILIFLGSIHSVNAYDFIQKSLRQNSFAVANNDPVTALKWNGLVLDISNVIGDIGSLKLYIDSNINTFFVETPTTLEQTTKDIKIGKDLEVVGDITSSGLIIPEGGFKDGTITTDNIKNGTIKLEDIFPGTILGGSQVFQLNGTNAYFNTGNVIIGTDTGTEKLTVNGNIKVKTAGKGIIFPDGTIQTTAVVSPTDNMLINSNQSISGIKKFTGDIALSNTDVKVNKLSIDNRLTENKATSLISEKAIIDYVGYKNKGFSGICGLDHQGTLTNKPLSLETLTGGGITTTVTQDKIYNWGDLTDAAKYSVISQNRTPTRTATKLSFDASNGYDESMVIRTPTNIYDFSIDPIEKLDVGFAGSIDLNDCRSTGSGMNLYQDDNNNLGFGMVSNAADARSRSCGASCNNKNFGATGNWSCVSGAGTCGPGRRVSFGVNQSGVYWNYIYQINGLGNSDFKYYSSVDLKNKTWKITIKNYSDNSVVLDTTVALPAPTNGINLANIKGNFKIQGNGWKSCGSRSPMIFEPYAITIPVKTVVNTAAATEMVMKDTTFDFSSFLDTAKYTTLYTAQTPTINATSMNVNNSPGNDENVDKRTIADVYKFTTPVEKMQLDFGSAVDQSDCRGQGANVYLIQDANNSIGIGFTSQAQSGRSYSCGASCNDKNFGGAGKWTCVSGSCGPGRFLGLGINQNGVNQNYIYQMNGLGNSDYKFFNTVDLKNKTWRIIVKNYSDNSLVSDATVALPAPANGLNISNVVGTYKVDVGVSRTCGGRARNFIEPLNLTIPMLTAVPITAGSSSSTGVPSPVNLCTQGVATNPIARTETINTPPTSCQDIKEKLPASADGIYSISPQGTPFDVYCDMTTEGGGWTLIGRGREGWAWNDAGMNTTNVQLNKGTINAFVPAYYGANVINSILGGMAIKDLPDGVRLKRASNTSGTTYQEIRWKFAAQNSWTWLFDTGTTGIPLNSVKIDSISYTGINTRDMDYNGTNTAQRIFTWGRDLHNYKTGFAYGAAVSEGMNNASYFIWENASENHGLAYTEVYVRKGTPNAANQIPKVITKGYDWTCAGINGGATVNCTDDVSDKIIQ